MTSRENIQSRQDLENDLKRSLETDELALSTDDEPFELPERNVEEVIALLESWYDPAEAEDQRETLEFLMRHLDEDRFTTRKLFP